MGGNWLFGERKFSFVRGQKCFTSVFGGFLSLLDFFSYPCPYCLHFKFSTLQACLAGAIQLAFYVCTLGFCIINIIHNIGTYLLSPLHLNTVLILASDSDSADSGQL